MRQQIQNILADYSKRLERVVFIGDTMQIVIADDSKSFIPVQLEVDSEGYAVFPSEQEVETAIDCFFVR